MAQPLQSKRISSSWTFFFKRVFRVLLFGGLAIGAVGILESSRHPRGAPVFLVVFPILIGGVFYLLMRQFFLDLVDEVWDTGNVLVAKNGSTEARIPLGEIINVNFARISNPERVTLTLRNQTPLGTEINFLAPTRFLNIGKHPLFTELVGRVDEARRG